MEITDCRVIVVCQYYFVRYGNCDTFSEDDWWGIDVVWCWIGGMPLSVNCCSSSNANCVCILQNVSNSTPLLLDIHWMKN